MIVKIAKLMTKAEYARHRGVTAQYINTLIKKGKIILEHDGKIDPEKADSILGPVKNSIDNHSIQQPPQPVMKIEHQPITISIPSNVTISEAMEITSEKILSSKTLFEAQQYTEVYKALTKKAEYKKIIGSLLLKEEVERELFESDRIIRDKILEMPSRICPSLPCSDEIRFAVEQAMKIEINNILEQLSHALSL